MIIPLTVEDFLSRGALVYGGRPGIVDEARAPGGSLGTLTYDELAGMARGLAVRLDELDVGLGERVAVLSPNSARLLCALFGVSAYGRVLVPINFRLNDDETRYIVEHSVAESDVYLHTLLTVNRARSEWTDLDPRERARRLSRAGAPAVGVRLDVDGEGEVLARSNHVFAGYWNQPEETAKAIPDGWFRTGDGGDLDEAYLTIADRKKDVIITGGENVSSIEVEDALFLHPAVAEVAVIAAPPTTSGETVKALVVLRHEATEEELIGLCRERLAHFKCPTSVEFRESLPRTATGKLQKFRLRQPYWEGRERHVS